MTVSVGVVDYGIGNVKSIIGALDKVGAQVILTDNPEQLLQSDAMILPGVGAFGHAMQQLKERNLDQVIREFTDSKRQFLGICVGMQLLFTTGEEFGEHAGLGIIPGTVSKISLKSESTAPLPHISWNELYAGDNQNWAGSILEGLGSGENVYFVHSYVGTPDCSQDILAVTEYDGLHLCAAVQHENITGCQFHPEKSGETGLKIIDNFIKKSR
ncbi:MAG: imidazole glycerol phosphate synthase subunit HisH [Robiginitomaculum sp.]|nr:MAG: imidazole glycerol phosphate synthase subunit HisH [Robiginitomaculum sp.]